MSPSEEVRNLLDERGIKWETGEDSLGNEETWWRSPVFDAYVCVTLGEELGTVQLDLPICFTPEQAIAATVGVGTCKLVDNDSGPDMHCTACGGEVDDEYRYFMDS